MAKGYMSLTNDVNNYQPPKVTTSKKKKKQEQEQTQTPLLYKAGNGIADKILGDSFTATKIDAAREVSRGALSSYEGVSDWAYREIAKKHAQEADVLEFFGLNGDKQRQKAKETYLQTLNNDTEDIMEGLQRLTQGDHKMEKTKEQLAQDDWVANKSQLDRVPIARSVLQGVGNSLANASMTGYIAPATQGLSGAAQAILGLTPMYMSAAGSGETEAVEAMKEKGNVNLGKARLYGILSGVIESGSEAMFGGLGKLSKAMGFSGGALDDVFIKKLTDKINNTLLKNGVDLALRGVGEGIEELVSADFGAWAKKLTYMSDKDIKELLKDENRWESFLSGMFSSILMQGPSTVSSSVKGQETTTGITKNENKVVDAVVEERTQGKDLTKKEINKIRQEVREELQEGYISTDTIEKTLGEGYDISGDQFLQESYREKARRQTGFQADVNQYTNEAQRKIIQKAIDSGILNDSKRTHTMVDFVSKIAADKGMDFDFLNNQKIKDSGFAVEGRIVNGLVNGNTIGLNIESNQSLNKTVGHEITHVLEGTELYKELQNSLKDYLGEEKWNARIKDLAETYKNVENANVENELTADLVGEYLFTDESFVNSLSVQNRNLFQKIFDEIKYLVSVATKGSQQAKQLAKVKKIFQEAYRTTNNTTNEAKYSMVGDKNIKDTLKRNDLTDQQRKVLARIQQNYNEALSKDGKVSNEQIRKETGWFKDKNGDWKFEITDKYSELKIKPQKNHTYTLGDLLDHKLLFDIEPRLKNLKVEFLDMKKSGSYFELPFGISKKIYASNDLLNLSEENIRSTLLHEIQHYNQYRNGFERGRSSGESLKDMEDYVRSLGEIEAKNVQERMDMSQEELRDTQPESAKENPIHPRAKELIRKREQELANKQNNNYNNSKKGLGSNAEEVETFNQENKNQNNREVWNRLEGKTSFSLSKDAIKDLKDITGQSASMLEANLGDDEYSVKNYLTRHTKLVENYMKNNNIEVEPVMKSAGLEKYSENYKNFVKDNDLSVLKLAKDENLLNQYFEAEKEYLSELPENILNGLIQTQKENFNYAKTWDEVPASLQSYEDEFNLIKNDTQEIVDDWETEKKIQREVVESPEFQKYLDKLVKPLFQKEYHTTEEIMEEAEYNHGTTDDYETGAYMTTNGNLLDFSDHGYRDDHRTIDVFDLDMNEFMEAGAIRMKPESNGFELAKEPTSEQYSKLYDYIDEYCKNNPDNGDIVVDIDTSKNNYDSQFYNINTPTSKIINDIKTYYETGSFPKQSDLAQFRYSLTVQEANTGVDNNGKELTKEQQEYFKDSKVTDENGNLMEVYHGTPYPFFTVFKASIGDSVFGRYKFNNYDVNYFTASRDTARGYTAIGIEEGNNIYKTYLNIVNPYVVENSSTADIKAWNNIKDNNIRQFETEYYDRFENKWNKEVGITENLDAINEDLFPFNCELRKSGEYYELYNLGNNDGWGEDLLLYVNENSTANELFEENIKESIYGESFNDYIYTSDKIAKWVITQNNEGANYDGIIIPDIMDTGSKGSMFGEPTTDYITFNSNQIKRVDNQNPTSNEDIRYSLSPSGEMVDNSTGEKVTLEVADVGTTGNLMVLHNMGENKLNGILDLDGIPVPSLAITDVEKVNFDQFGGATAIFDKKTIDPSNYKNEVYDRDVWSPTQPRIDYEINEKNIDRIAKEIGVEDYTLKDYAEDRNGAEDLARTLADRDSVVEKFVKDKNIKYETAYKEQSMNQAINNSKVLQEFIKKNDITFEKLVRNEELRNQYISLAEWYIDKNMMFERQKQEARYFLQDLDNAQNGLRPYFDEDFENIKNGKTSNIIDEYLTERNMKEAARENGLEEYLKNKVKDVYGEKGIYNGKEYITETGRRTFWQLHNKYTLNNLVKELTKGNTKGTQETLGTGIGQIQASMGNQFNSIEEIQNARENIKANADELTQELRDKTTDDIGTLANYVDSWGSYDIVSELLIDVANSGDLSVDNVRRIIRKDYDPDLNNATDTEIQNILDDLEQWKNIPTDYFEAKPQRAVSLKEIQQLLIPQNFSEETKQRVKDKGIPYVEYDSTIPGERQRLEKQFEDLKFSLARNDQINPTDIAPTGWNLRSEDVRLQQALAPLEQKVQQLTQAIENIAPLSEEEAVNLPIDENIQAPIRNNLTLEESKRLDLLEQMDREGILEGAGRDLYDELLAKENPIEEEISPVRGLDEIRDYDEVGKRDVNAYQYDHPEVKPFFQEEAKKMLRELNEYTPGQRLAIPGKSNNISDWEWIGITRDASDDIARLLDGTDGYKYNPNDIRKGLNAIIEDNGNENIAVAKRLEFILDERLRNGYDAWDMGGILKDSNGDPIRVQPNQDYLNMLKEQEWDNYYDELPFNRNVPETIQEDVLTGRPQEVAPSKQTQPIQPRQVQDIMPYVEQQATRSTEKAPVKKQKKKGSVKKTVQTLQSGLVNRNVLIDDMAKEFKNKNIKFKGDMWNNYMAEAQSDINNYQTDINGNAIGNGVNTIFDAAEKAGIPRAVFNEFLIDYSNIDRWRQNKGSQTPYEESARRLRDYAIKYPQIRQYAQQVWKFGQNSLQNRVDAGLMTQDTADMLKKIYPHYVPYVSQAENLDNYYKKLNELKPNSLKRARGGAGALMPVQEALANYVMSEKRSIRQNELFNEIIDTLGEGNNFGIDKADYTGMADSLFQDEQGNYLTAYKDGKQRTTMIDNDLYKELSRSTEQQIRQMEENLSAITKPLQAISELRRKFLTSYNPVFALYKNPAKDVQDAAYYSKYTKDMLKNLPGSYGEMYQPKTDLGRQFKALYGSPEYKGFGKNYAKLSEAIELAPRFAEFKASIEHGCSVQEAMYNAREVTTNFSRGGTIVKAMNRNGFTFLNASIQGFDKFIRNFSEQENAKGYVGVLAKSVVLGILPAVFNELAFGSGDDKDEEYEALPDYIKDNYYLFKLGNGEFLRIPKGRALSIFGSAARRTMKAAQGEENAFEGWLSNAWSQIGPVEVSGNPLDNTIIAPIVQAAQNRAWYGGDLVPSRLQKLPTEEQYDASTDKLSIWLGQKTGISPYKINYVLDQYSGGIGDMILPMITEEATSDGSLLAPLKDQFVVDNINDNKYVSDFYSLSDELTKKKNSANATDEDILQYKYINSVSYDLSELYKERREVQANPDLTKKEKYEQASEIKKEINKMAEDALKEYKDVQIIGDTATVNGVSYYKKDGEWKKGTKKK